MANADALSWAKTPPSIEYICVLKQESPKPRRKEHRIASIADDVMKASSSVGANGDLLGKFRNITKNAAKWKTNPPITIGSRPHLVNLAPRIPNSAPPSTSPAPMNMPDRPTSCFALSPNALVNPMAEL
uniref:Uncharacterized protein n=1 Tax=Photinus pyralis TaxID=7054 RepID=A0A1Y1N4U7_PHOPY